MTPFTTQLVERLLALPAGGPVPDDLQSEVRLVFNKARGDLMDGDAGSIPHTPGHGLDLLLAASHIIAQAEALEIAREGKAAVDEEIAVGDEKEALILARIALARIAELVGEGA